MSLCFHSVEAEVMWRCGGGQEIHDPLRSSCPVPDTPQTSCHRPGEVVLPPGCPQGYPWEGLEVPSALGEGRHEGDSEGLGKGPRHWVPPRMEHLSGSVRAWGAPATSTLKPAGVCQAGDGSLGVPPHSTGQGGDPVGHGGDSMGQGPAVGPYPGGGGWGQGD